MNFRNFLRHFGSTLCFKGSLLSYFKLPEDFQKFNLRVFCLKSSSQLYFRLLEYFQKSLEPKNAPLPSNWIKNQFKKSQIRSKKKMHQQLVLHKWIFKFKIQQFFSLDLLSKANHKKHDKNYRNETHWKYIKSGFSTPEQVNWTIKWIESCWEVTLKFRFYSKWNFIFDDQSRSIHKNFNVVTAVFLVRCSNFQWFFFSFLVEA